MQNLCWRSLKSPWDFITMYSCKSLYILNTKETLVRLLVAACSYTPKYTDMHGSLFPKDISDIYHYFYM